MKFCVLLAAFLIAAPLIHAEEKQTSEQLYQEAYENFVKRDYTGASASLDKINPVDQKKADILNLRGAIYKRLGELDNAANAYSDALKVNPKDWVPKYNLAEVNFLREQYKSARTYLEQSLASMPEADRLQKQDLILYKVYLTYLLQGDDEKAKLLLDSFDINSSNPVYYFAQAAWSFKKKDAAKAKTWVNSTDGLYSQDLRNSYGQALVDVGWLEPSAGVGNAALTPNATQAAAATASVTPVASVSASPTPAGIAVVPLATNDATPIAIAEASATPAATVSAVPVAATSVPDFTPLPEAKAEETGFPVKTAVAILAVLAVAFFLLLNLAKRSRIVPPPEDNTGYDAIAASGSSDASGHIAHSSEGTGAVLEQDANGEIAPAAIKVTPIHRDYAETKEEDVVSGSGRRSTAKTSKRGKPSPKTVLATKTTTIKKPAKVVAPKETPNLAAVAEVAKAPAKKTVKSSKKSPLEVESKTTATGVRTTKKAGDAKRPRLIPVETITVPPPDIAAPKLMVSNIETIKQSEVTGNPVPAKPSVKKAPAKAPAKAAPKKAPAKAAAPRPAAPLITIPEFEDTNLEASAGSETRSIPAPTAAKDLPQND